MGKNLAEVSIIIRQFDGWCCSLHVHVFIILSLKQNYAVTTQSYDLSSLVSSKRSYVKVCQLIHVQ